MNDCVRRRQLDLGEHELPIREVVDHDFGYARRHGYERIIPNDFGVPQNVSSTSPDANAHVGIDSPEYGFTRIRLGDPDTTYTGQHRYVLYYTLPNAQLSSGVLHLDIIGTDEELDKLKADIDHVRKKRKTQS